ncbi:hypothetical protein [Salinithrix halophila]|uniref:Uncharacterized protein n=1 Tax=Salinithrix halophila TaxID=1485204 RepID=A0ABV8JE10_9BACL
MITYTARISFMRNHPGMRYLQRGDRVVIRGKAHEVREVFTWDGKLVYDTDWGLLYAEELERI